MTNAQAIKTLERIYGTYYVIHEDTNGDCGYEAMIALDMAIEALSLDVNCYEDDCMTIHLPIGWQRDQIAKIILFYDDGKSVEYEERREAWTGKM